MMVLFNGTYYIIVCLTDSKHLLILNIRAKKLDGERSIAWLKNVAEEMNTKTDAQ